MMGEFLASIYILRKPHGMRKLQMIISIMIFFDKYKTEQLIKTDIILHLLDLQLDANFNLIPSSCVWSHVPLLCFLALECL